MARAIVDPIDRAEELLARRVQTLTSQALRPIDAVGVARDAAAVGRARPGRPTMRRRLLVLPIAFLIPLGALAMAAAGLVFTAGQQATSPAPTADPLAGLLTEPVEPGVYRVVDDGADHDLTSLAHVTTGPDGSVWVKGPGLLERDAGTPTTLFRLGVRGAFDAGPTHETWPDLTVGPDGTVWGIGSGGTECCGTAGGPQLVALSDGVWVVHEPAVGDRVSDVEIPGDGSVLVSTGSLCRVWKVGHDGWEELPRQPGAVSVGHGGGLVDPDGRPWLAVASICPTSGGIAVYDGHAWTAAPLALHGQGLNAHTTATGPDGTLWAYAPDVAGRPSAEGQRLARLADGAWTTFDESDGVPILVSTQMWGFDMGVGHDGTLWLTFTEDTWHAFSYNRAVFNGPDDTGPCAGVRSFDGETWKHFLGGPVCRQPQRGAGRPDLGDRPWA